MKLPHLVLLACLACLTACQDLRDAYWSARINQNIELVDHWAAYPDQPLPR